jgi:hypothetical protein
LIFVHENDEFMDEAHSWNYNQLATETDESIKLPYVGSEDPFLIMFTVFNSLFFVIL